MPTYEFNCLACGCGTTIFTRSIGAAHDARCSHCSSESLVRVLSGFAYHRSEQAVLVDYGSEPKCLKDFKDYRQIGRSTERFFKERGVEMPKEVRRMIEAAREGELPDP